MYLKFPGAGGSFGFANCIHRTASGTESLKAFVSGSHEWNSPPFSPGLRWGTRKVRNAAKILAETLLWLRPKEQIIIWKYNYAALELEVISLIKSTN